MTADYSPQAKQVQAPATVHAASLVAYREAYMELIQHWFY